MSRIRLNQNTMRGVLDWRLIMAFLHLSVNEKADVAKKIGAKVQDIIEDIVRLHRLTQQF